MERRMAESSSDQVQLHVLSRRKLAEGSVYAGWDESICSARLSAEKHRALLANPLSRDDDEPMQVIGTRGARVIGRMDLIAGELILRDGDEDRTVPLLWGSNLFVPAEERKSMMGVMLVMKASAAFHTVGAHGPSQMALPLYEKLRFAKVPLDRFILLRRSASVISRYVGTGPLGGAARLAADTALVGLRGVNAIRRALAGVRMRRVDLMPSEFDGVLARPSRCTPVRAHRSSAWINWLLASQFEPQRRHERALYLLEGSRGEALGYILMKVKFHATATHRAFPNLTLATLADWGIFDASRSDDLSVIHAAIRATGDLNADALEVCLQPGDARTSRLRPLGFLPAGTMSGMWKAGPKSPLAGDRFTDPSSWTLRYGDGENVPG